MRSLQAIIERLLFYVHKGQSKLIFTFNKPMILCYLILCKKVLQIIAVTFKEDGQPGG